MHIAVLLKTKSKKATLHPNFAQQETAYNIGSSDVSDDIQTACLGLLSVFCGSLK